MKQFLDSHTFNLVCGNYRNGMIDHPTFLRFLADQYEAADRLMVQLERLYINRDPEESAAWCDAHYRTYIIGIMLEKGVRFEGF